MFAVSKGIGHQRGGSRHMYFESLLLSFTPALAPQPLEGAASQGRTGKTPGVPVVQSVRG
ncbi:hypothetical protein U1Q18_050603, partial [Sarracenia purpurea var. burkii]